MSGALKRAWSIATTVLVVISILLAVAVVGVRLVGIKTYAVVSGSMEPVYPTGCLLYVKSVDPSELKVGDSITFMLSEDTVATHRIVEIVEDNEENVLRFRTKGDANASADGTPVHEQNIIGKPIFSVPYLGYFANFVQNPPGMYLAFGVVAVIIILVFLPDLFKDGERKAASPEEEGEAEKR